MDIRQIREFLLNGCESRIDRRSYIDRLEEAEERVWTRLREEYPNAKQFNEIMDLITAYATTLEEVYMDIGMQAGAALVTQILKDSEKK